MHHVREQAAVQHQNCISHQYDQRHHQQCADQQSHGHFHTRGHLTPITTTIVTASSQD